MAIGHAVQKGTLVYIYDADGRQITSLSAPGRWPDDGLKGFTQNAVHVQKGTLLYAYDECGHQLGMPVPVRPQNIIPSYTARQHGHEAIKAPSRYIGELVKAIPA